jgi:hypothetical protein
MFAVSDETEAWPHEFLTSNGSVYGQIIFTHGIAFSSTTSEILSPQINVGEENLTHIWYAVTVCLFNNIRNTLTNVISYQHCMHYRYLLVFLICMCSSINIHCHGLYYSLAVKQCFLTIKYSWTLKVMGLYTMSVSVFAVLCLQMHWSKSTTYYCCIICSFPNNLPRMCGEVREAKCMREVHKQHYAIPK